MDACSGMFDIVCACGATKLKSSLSLYTLVEAKEDEGIRHKQKTEAIMDDLRSVSVCGTCKIN